MIEKKTKIVCTIGPATWDPAVMEQMIKNGMNCARVNGAFADPDELDKVARLVRDVSDEVALMVDVKGPEIRLNKFEKPKELKPRMELIIGNDDTDEFYPANYKDVYKSVEPGQRVVIGDGDVELVVEKVEDGKLYTRVVFGELLKPGKAMNLPGCEYSEDILTEKDKENLDHAIKTGWDFVSVSFIKDAQSAQKVKDYIGKAKMQIIAKIEDQEGVDNIDEILKVVDGIMIARGGLGVELGLEKTPIVERELIRKSNAVGKPVITATQMLESMIENPRPTRAEVSDVATAILLGTDAVMLSGESSAGQYPIEAVKMLTTTALEAENYIDAALNNNWGVGSRTSNAIAKAAAEMMMNMEGEVKAVVVVTKTGATAKTIGMHNITQPIYAFVGNGFRKRTTMLSKGVTRTYEMPEINPKEKYDRDFALEIMLKKVRELGIAKSGEKILFVGKTPVDSKDYFPNIFEIVSV